MQGQFQKNFRRRPCRRPAALRRGARALGAGAIRCPIEPAGRAPRAGGAAAARLSGALMTSRDPPSAAFRPPSAFRHAPGGHSAGSGPIIGPDRASAHSLISKPCRITGLYREPPSMPELANIKPQVGGLCIPLNAGHGRPVRVQPRNPAWFWNGTGALAFISICSPGKMP